MKKLILVALSLSALSTTSFARSDQQRDQMKRIQRLATSVATLSLSRLINKTPRDLNEIERALKLSQRVLLGQRRRPPNRSYTPRYVACSSNFNHDFVSIQNKIEDAASRYMGLDFGAEDKFAGEWVDTYPCEFADEYIDNAKNLEEAASRYMGMDFGAEENYAKENADKLCPDVDIRAVAKKFRDLGASRGLDFGAEEKFAKEKVEEAGLLSCSMPKVN